MGVVTFMRHDPGWNSIVEARCYQGGQEVAVMDHLPLQRILTLHSLSFNAPQARLSNDRQNCSLGNNINNAGSESFFCEKMDREGRIVLEASQGSNQSALPGPRHCVGQVEQGTNHRPSQYLPPSLLIIPILASKARCKLDAKPTGDMIVRALVLRQLPSHAIYLAFLFFPVIVKLHHTNSPASHSTCPATATIRPYVALYLLAPHRSCGSHSS